MKVLELFAGTRSIGKAFERSNKGHKVFSCEWDKDFENIDYQGDIGVLTADYIEEHFGLPDVIWASPDCTTYSVTAMGYYRKKNKETGNLDVQPFEEILDTDTPKEKARKEKRNKNLEYANFCDNVNQHVLRLIEELNQRRLNKGLKQLFYFIENPRGGLRTQSFMQKLPRYTVTYCKYMTDRPLNERYMKPTDIWTNHPNPKFLPPSKNGDKDHVSAPRGTQKGLQAIKGSKDRSRIPNQLCDHIVEICEEEFK